LFCGDVECVLLASKRTYNATVAETDGRRRATELIFLDRGPLVLRALAIIVAAAGCGLAGYVLFRLHLQLAAHLAAGAALNPLQALIASGSSARTLWPGWLAAVFFLLAVIRLRRGPIEPAPGVRSPERMTPGQLRSGLRREYTVVRALLVVVCLVAAVDGARAISYVSGAVDGHSVSTGTLVSTLVEAAGFAAAALVLAVWAWLFGADVRRLGAI
jgi:hypothetical protein